jgi:putative ABC transport system permease protein
MSQILGVQKGDWLEVETMGAGERRQRYPVTGITAQYVGSNAYTTLATAAAISTWTDACTTLLIQGSPQVRVDLEKMLRDSAMLALIESRTDKIDAFNALMGNSMLVYAYMGLISVLIGFAVIYTSSLICFEEMKRELATMLTLGLKSSECLEVISTGQWLLTLGGIVLGVPLTFGASRAMTESYNTDSYSIPSFISVPSLLLAVLLTFVAVYFANVMIHRKLRRLAPVELLRERV